MAFVSDFSRILCWAFTDKKHPLNMAALNNRQQGKARVPNFRWFKVGNALVMNERRGCLTEAKTSFLRNLAQLTINVNGISAEAGFSTFTRQHRITVYDATNFELTRREG